MSDIADGIGGIALGAAAAHAAERELAPGGADGTDGAAKGKGHFHESACLNCGTQLIGSHCHSCGQEAHLHRTFGAFFHDLLHGVLHLDGKIWRTLPMLAFHPGQLTRDYIEGHRRRYVSPMALFLFSVFAMFAVFSMVGLSVPADVKGPAVKGDMEAALANMDRQIGGAKGELTGLEEGTPEYEEVSGRLNALEKTRETMTSLSATEEMVTERDTGIALLDKGLKKWRTNPSLMIYKLQSSGYKFSWLLIPISLPFMWLMFFWKRRFGMYDHAVFVTYSIAFMSLLFIAASVLVAVGVPNGWVIGACLIIPLVHIYKQLKYGYELSRVGALVRTAAMVVVVDLTIAIFFFALLALGIMG